MVIHGIGRSQPVTHLQGVRFVRTERQKTLQTDRNCQSVEIGQDLQANRRNQTHLALTASGTLRWDSRHHTTVAAVGGWGQVRDGWQG